MDHRMVSHCANHFCGGCVSIDNDPKPGRPKTSTDERSVKLVADALEEDRATGEELSRAMGAKTTESILDADMEKDGAYKMDRQNKNCIYARKNWRRKNCVGTDKEEEKKLAGPLDKKGLSTEGCSRRNGKREESSRQIKISNDY